MQDDLKRAGITPYAWTINQCLSKQEESSNPLLLQKASAEGVFINNIEDKLADKFFGIPYLPEKHLMPAL